MEIVDSKRIQNGTYFCDSKIKKRTIPKLPWGSQYFFLCSDRLRPKIYNFSIIWASFFQKTEEQMVKTPVLKFCVHIGPQVDDSCKKKSDKTVIICYAKMKFELELVSYQSIQKRQQKIVLSPT
jgi:hypothetical protein